MFNPVCRLFPQNTFSLSLFLAKLAKTESSTFLFPRSSLSSSSHSHPLNVSYPWTISSGRLVKPFLPSTRAFRLCIPAGLRNSCFLWPSPARRGKMWALVSCGGTFKTSVFWLICWCRCIFVLRTLIPRIGTSKYLHVLIRLLLTSFLRLLQGLYWGNPSGSVEPLFLRMHYYTGWVRYLKLSSDAFDRRFIGPLSRLCGPLSLFPTLQTILWVVETEPPSLASLGTLVAACRAPQVKSLAINIRLQPQDFDDQRMLSNSILQALIQASDNTAISSLTIIGAPSFSIPISALRGFLALRNANIQVNLIRMSCFFLGIVMYPYNVFTL